MARDARRGSQPARRGFPRAEAAIDAREAALFRGSWIGDYNDAYSFLQILKGGFGINLPRYESAAYDAALEAAGAAAGGPDARLLASAERQLLDDVPLIPLYFYVSKHLVAPRVHGWYDNVMNVTYSKDLTLQRGRDRPALQEIGAARRVPTPAGARRCPGMCPRTHRRSRPPRLQRITTLKSAIYANRPTWHDGCNS